MMMREEILEQGVTIKKSTVDNSKEVQSYPEKFHGKNTQLQPRNKVVVEHVGRLQL
jgi:hypothetical protein